MKGIKMKKKFIKPEIQKISLNFQENIVASELYRHSGGYYMKSQDEATCTIVDTPYIYSVMSYDQDKYNQAFGCLVRGVSPERAARMLGIEL